MIVPLKDRSITETLNQLFRDLLDKGIVDALIVPQAVFSGRGTVHTLVKDPSQIKHATPFLAFLPGSGASVASSLTTRDPEQKLGVVLRSCELRALVELAKFKQANLDNLFLIGVDCLGTVESAEFEKMTGDGGGFNVEQYLADQVSGDLAGLRKACQVCARPVPENVAMNIGFIGADLKKGIYLETSEDIAAKLGIEAGEDTPAREGLVSEIVQDRSKRRQDLIAELRERFSSVTDLLNEFARCKRCFNCREECPICYCKKCVFLTDVFEHKPDQYLRRAERKGAIRLPYDTLLFHLTRLNHMVSSCVACGQCSSACPNDLPVFELFQLVGEDVQELFEYNPGKDVEEAPPVATFREEELEAL